MYTPWDARSVLLESPSMRRVWIEIARPPLRALLPTRSPSMRRVWIEIADMVSDTVDAANVTLHAEGVD